MSKVKKKHTPRSVYVKDVPDLRDSQVLLKPDLDRLEFQLGGFRHLVSWVGDQHNWYGLSALAWVGLTPGRDTDVNPYGPGGEYRPAVLVVGWAGPPTHAAGFPDVRSVLVEINPNRSTDYGCRVVGWRSLVGGLGRTPNHWAWGRHLFDAFREVGWLVASLDLVHRLADHCLGLQVPCVTPQAPLLTVNVGGKTYSADDDIPVDLADQDRPTYFGFDTVRLGYNAYADHVTGKAVSPYLLPGWGVVPASVLGMNFPLSEYVRISYAL